MLRSFGSGWEAVTTNVEASGDALPCDLLRLYTKLIYSGRTQNCTHPTAVCYSQAAHKTAPTQQLCTAKPLCKQGGLWLQTKPTSHLTQPLCAAKPLREQGGRPALATRNGGRRGGAAAAAAAAAGASGREVWGLWRCADIPAAGGCLKGRGMRQEGEICSIRHSWEL
eukprot:354726-Chlamydomonas_euryale.AAC.3